MREMSIKKRFVRRYVLKSSKPFSGHDLQDAINQQEGVPVRKDLPNPVNVYFCFHKFYSGELLTPSPGSGLWSSLSMMLPSIEFNVVQRGAQERDP